MAKLQRNYRLEVEDVNRQVRVIEPPLTLDFDVNKAIFGNVCTASITVYNLKATTRDSIYKDLRLVGLEQLRNVTLYAGYLGEELTAIFRGTISNCYSRRQGTEFLTTIECNSGSDFLANSYVNLPVAKDTPVAQVMAQLAASINPNASRYIGNFSGTIKRATTLTGLADKLIKDYSGGAFYIDDNSILVLKDNEHITGLINAINSDTGLLGTPQREEDFLVFDIIFEPRLLIGQNITLESSTFDYFNGVYKVLGVHHSGTISEAICGVAKTTVRVSFYGPGGAVVGSL